MRIIWAAVSEAVVLRCAPKDLPEEMVWWWERDPTAGRTAHRRRSVMGMFSHDLSWYILVPFTSSRTDPDEIKQRRVKRNPTGWKMQKCRFFVFCQDQMKQKLQMWKKPSSIEFFLFANLTFYWLAALKQPRLIDRVQRRNPKDSYLIWYQQTYIKLAICFIWDIHAN